MTSFRYLPLTVFALSACGSSDAAPNDPGDPPADVPGDAGAYMPTDDPATAIDHGVPDITHTFPTLSMAPGEELGSGSTDQICFVWHMDNPEPVWINKIVETNQGGFHHSNWFIYPDTFAAFPEGGVDGVWHGCPATTQIGIGNVAFFFAQSTQALVDVQEFEPGAAFELPPNAIVVGNMHMLNTTSEAVDVEMKFDLHTIDAADVQTPLKMSTYSIQRLAIPANAQTSAALDCPFPDTNVDVHYALSHYHQWGTAMRAETDGQSFFETIGEPSGRRLDPPMRLGSNVKFTCDYDNDSGGVLQWVNSSAGEMCILMMFTSGRGYAGVDILNPDCLPSGDAISQ